jgi:hypothetical protein
MLNSGHRQDDADLGLHFVGSVPPSEHPELLARPGSDRALIGRYADEG